MTAILWITLCFLSLIYSIHCQCPIAGCQANRCYCVDTIKELNKNPKVHFVQSPLQLSNKGCLASVNNIVCPLDEEEASKTKSGCITLHYLSPSDHTWWRCNHINHTVSLPIIDVSGNVIASDGYTLAAYYSDGRIVPPAIELYPNTGQIVDMLFTNNTLFEMIYRCGLIVAYLPDGTAWASIWINNTSTTNGTFVPLSTPAIKGERMYLLTGFWPTNASGSSNGGHHGNRRGGGSVNQDPSFMIRLYAIDSTTIMVGRLRIAWYHEVKLEGYLPAIERSYNSCRYHPPSPDDQPSSPTPPLQSSPTPPPLPSDNIETGQVTVSGDTVIVTLNYNTISNTSSHYIISINDAGTSYTVDCAQSVNNEIVMSLAMAHGADSNYTIKAIQLPSAGSGKDTQLRVFETPDVCKSSAFKTIDISSILMLSTGLTATLTSDLLVLQPQSKSGSLQLYVVFGVQVAMKGVSSSSDVDHTYIVSALSVDDGWDEVVVYWNNTSPNMITGQVSVLGETICFTSKNGLFLYE